MFLSKYREADESEFTVAVGTEKRATALESIELILLLSLALGILPLTGENGAEIAIF